MKRPFAIGFALGAAAVLALEFGVIELYAWLNTQASKDQP